jgi:hypothetical protein
LYFVHANETRLFTGKCRITYLQNKKAMRSLLSLLIVVTLTLTACHSEISKSKRGLVDAINKKVAAIDHNHRVMILDEDHKLGDSIFKTRGYFANDKLIKLVGILRTPHFERDDYFYFENNEPLFSGHMINFKDDNLAEEFKYYYENGNITEALMWEDHYDPHKRFPHEHFEEFEPNIDSLLSTERTRLQLFLKFLNMSGHEIKHLNENLGAN